MGKFSLMALPYEADALQPVISKDTISFHHGKHLAAYVSNLNALLPAADWKRRASRRLSARQMGAYSTMRDRY